MLFSETTKQLGDSTSLTKLSCGSQFLVFHEFESKAVAFQFIFKPPEEIKLLRKQKEVQQYCNKTKVHIVARGSKHKIWTWNF